MNNDNRTLLTILEACTLLARETVSMLEGLDQLPDSAVTLRGALALVGEDLGDGGALLAWVDSEMEMVRHFAETNEQTTPLVEREVPCALPDPIMQQSSSIAGRLLHPPQGRGTTAANRSPMADLAGSRPAAHGDRRPG